MTSKNNSKKIKIINDDKYYEQKAIIKELKKIKKFIAKVKES